MDGGNSQRLSALLENEEFHKVLQLTGKILELEPNSTTALHAKIFAQLNVNKWQDALTTIEKAHDSGVFELAPQDFAFEKSVCFYRLNRFSEALDSIAAAEPSDRIINLEAQVRYRMADYAKSAEIYAKQLKADPSDAGLQTNLIAALVSGEQYKKALDVSCDGYEGTYNQACALLEESSLHDAREKLQIAKELCVAELEQDGEDAENLDEHPEIAWLDVQRAALLQKDGCETEAEAIYKKWLELKATDIDVTVLAVACNNLIALQPEGKSLLDQLKRIASGAKENLDHKLTQKQAVAIGVNKCLLLLQAKKRTDCRRVLGDLRAKFPDNPRLALVEAAIAHAENKMAKCEEQLTSALKTDPGCEFLMLALAGFYIQSGKAEKAANSLLEMPIKLRAKPGMLAASVALLQKTKGVETSQIVKLCREAIDFYAKSGDESALGQVLVFSAEAAEKLKEWQFCTECWKRFLSEIDGSDTRALCGIVNAASYADDVELASQYVSRLPTPNTTHLDPEELENGIVPKIKKVEAEEAAVVQKQKRKKRIRYPKGFDPANPGPPPDPERWLPKRERTEYKKRMKKKHMLQRGPQGAMVVDEQMLNKGPSTAQVQVASEGAGRSRKKRK